MMLLHKKGRDRKSEWEKWMAICKEQENTEDNKQDRSRRQDFDLDKVTMNIPCDPVDKNNVVGITDINEG